jgi:nitroimidazol reductase NimA-like FMN-containing flavoprotein (pyridoxamine 5'-phosphate oxidase superfamily)
MNAETRSVPVRRPRILGGDSRRSVAGARSSWSPTARLAQGGRAAADDGQRETVQADITDWRAMEPEECLRLLREHHLGRVAVMINGFPEIFPMHYRLMETTGLTWIALGTQRGHAIDRASTNTAFEIDDLASATLQPWSVLVRGTLHRVDPDAADFRERFDPVPWPAAERNVWHVIQPFAITGRRSRTTARARDGSSRRQMR